MPFDQPFRTRFVLCQVVISSDFCSTNALMDLSAIVPQVAVFSALVL